ncbi:PD-(D/E)XK nuclease domain-containing protein [Prevotella sp.]|uniref:PD-(D/E)XK nuclease domain-containing protein n=1 Tax=Prevotella sp. TaxID=59823 RepID=UPI003AF4EAF0
METKMTRENLADKELSKQLIQDIAQYQTHHDVNTLVCFVYDPGQYIENPSGIIRDLESQSSDKLMVKVLIVS